jgi:hypothetical protein
LNANRVFGSINVVGTGEAAGVDGWGTVNLSWIPLRGGGHLESGFIVPVLTKITEAG